ncbi:DUF4908 domain-containing protein [Maricaulis sp.]|uniref:DUF4908 domain-containing protein n=1 Tax=Maricaulis sp. TaxID=1486257 RepID=UPI00260DCEC1|nr:DUF4908 domain-containing protein [Maricaulis sp.]
MTRFIFAILAAALLADAAAALQSNPLRDRLLRNERQQESSGWYQRADSGDFFLFDRSQSVALLRERDDPDAEVLVLFANRAPGGGTSFVTDTGREVVRLNPLGGATYFPADAPGGVIADYASPAGGLAPTPRSPAEVRDMAQEVAASFADALNRNIAVEYAPAPRSGLGVQYDTLILIEIALREARSERRRLRRLENINIELGAEPGAVREGEMLRVTIAPEYGYAGRPSSARIARAMLDDDNA